jgi:anthranilate 1,2-dioxygenase small subunit
MERRLLLRLELSDLQDRYVAAIDANRLEDWPGFFLDNCLYEIIPLENVKDGFPAPVIRCEGIRMLRDRIASLRNANIYEEQTFRHFTTALQIVSDEGDQVRTTCNYLVLSTGTAGRTTIYQTGQYEDVFARTADGWRFLSKRAIFDTSRVQTLLAYPI